MADATMERSLAAAIDSSVAAAAAGTLIWLVPPPVAHYQNHHPVDIDGDGHTITTAGDDDDDVAGLLEEFIPRDSDLDEQIIECPMIQRVLLLAMASLQQQEAAIDDDIQMIVSQQLEAYHPNGAVPAPAAAVANLGKQTFFRAAGAGGDDGGSVDHHQRRGFFTCSCSICMEDFEDGQEISVMPCSGRHGFHSNCITKWLGQYSNACPLCRHVLPIVVDDDR